jgi:hypothetical protein
MNRYLHAELKRIDDLVNDVEMQVPDISNPSRRGSSKLIVGG